MSNRTIGKAWSSYRYRYLMLTRSHFFILENYSATLPVPNCNIMYKHHILNISKNLTPVKMLYTDLDICWRLTSTRIDCTSYIQLLDIRQNVNANCIDSTELGIYMMILCYDWYLLLRLSPRKSAFISMYINSALYIDASHSWRREDRDICISKNHAASDPCVFLSFINWLSSRL